ncbi:hypothetical protein OUZ56_028569 [Daphnia magna]|uniref:Uncharacterized protein n=1 Tax=Daphnia magna TaxID=35525 RepID=A0ABR0B4C5_9CRUS|nr:hypothetical protein OUZ56_028569 [Daphnia magna]
MKKWEGYTLPIFAKIRHLLEINENHTLNSKVNVDFEKIIFFLPKPVVSETNLRNLSKNSTLWDPCVAMELPLKNLVAVMDFANAASR